eukprot:m.148721 g.148721  ORF g.148721 m.148721 type:complete len:463 (+) comp15061_c0_seq3:218-1606(+)
MARQLSLAPESFALGQTIGYTSAGLPLVCAATIIATGQIVAIKQISLEALCENQDKFDRVQRTLHLETQLLHPTLLTHMAAITVPGPQPLLWIVSPLMEHGSVAEILLSVSTRGLEEIVVAHIVREVLKALEYLHSLQTMMRVVCAQSVFVAADCSIRIGGFEHALSFQGRPRVFDVITAPDHIPWIAPEVLRQDHRGYTHTADMYSLATCAYETAFGTKPFDDLEVPKVFLMKMTEEFPSPPIGHHMSPSFVDFLRLCTAAPHMRPSATRLLAHSFITQVKRTPPALYHLCTSLPPLHDRAARIAALRRQQPQTYDPMFLQPHLSRIAFPGLAMGGLTYARPSGVSAHSVSTHGGSMRLDLVREESDSPPGMVAGPALASQEDDEWDYTPFAEEEGRREGHNNEEENVHEAQEEHRDRVAYANDGADMDLDDEMAAGTAGGLVVGMAGLTVAPHNGSTSSL